MTSDEPSEECTGMAEILVHEFTTLDGVIDAPTWTFGYPFDPLMGEAIGGVMGGCRAILLGRRTFEMFAPAWSGRSADDDPGAPFMNDSPKYVVTGAPLSAEWQNSTAIGPYEPDAIRRLKNDVEGDIYVSGSGTLVRAMVADGLVDQIHLLVYPTTVGSGPRLFEDGAPGRDLDLLSCQSFANGVVHLAYRSTAD
jgi:dihydrofolate reductase